eukprot:1156608-Pelagomonas_calceolata.AAC.6
MASQVMLLLLMILVSCPILMLLLPSPETDPARDAGTASPALCTLASPASCTCCLAAPVSVTAHASSASVKSWTIAGVHHGLFPHAPPAQLFL